jgi:O-antigen ligase
MGLAVGFGMAIVADRFQDNLGQAFQLATRYSSYLVPLSVAGLLVVFLLIRYPEVTLALFLLCGIFKSDELLASLPVDLTLALAFLLVLSIALRILTRKQMARLPSEFYFYLPIIFLMVLSLTYTPDLEAGLDKTLRFVFLTCLAAAAPFAVLTTWASMKRFFLSFVACGTAVALSALPMLGGSARLVAFGGDTGELGFATAMAMTILWIFFFPEMPFLKRLALYPVIAVLAAAMIGSGERRYNVAAALLILLCVLLYPRLVRDLSVFIGGGLLLLPFVRIPAASYEYLGTLMHPPQAFESRGPLMEWGLRLFLKHPFLGVGIQGYRYYTPDPVNYNFAHNIVLELGCELGIVAVLAFLGLAFCSLETLLPLLKDQTPRLILLSRAVLFLLIFVSVDAAVGGDINDRRVLWFVLSLPFLLREWSLGSFEMNGFSGPNRLSPEEA